MAFLRPLGIVVVIALVAAAAAFGTRPEASALETVHLARGSVISLATPDFVQVGKRYAFTWAGGGPAHSYVVKATRADGWVLVEVADENLDPRYYVPGELPVRWLHIATAISIQEMRGHPF